jgi:hypothetical protein
MLHFMFFDFIRARYGLEEESKIEGRDPDHVWKVSEAFNVVIEHWKPYADVLGTGGFGDHVPDPVACYVTDGPGLNGNVRRDTMCVQLNIIESAARVLARRPADNHFRCDSGNRCHIQPFAGKIIIRLSRFAGFRVLWRRRLNS